MPYETFCFLIDAGQLTAADPKLDPLKSEDADFRKAVEAVFEPWARTCCRQGDYWHIHKALLMRDGRVVQFVDDGDWLKRDEEVRRWRDDDAARNAVYTSMTGIDFDPWLQKIILYAMRQMTRCMFRLVIEDEDTVGGLMFSEAESMTTAEILRWFLTDVPQDISRMYFSECGETLDNNGAAHHRSERISRVLAYESFRASVLPPFTRERCKPEQYFCFDLRADPTVEVEPAKLAFLLTDINIPE